VVRDSAPGSWLGVPRRNRRGDGAASRSAIRCLTNHQRSRVHRSAASSGQTIPLFYRVHRLQRRSLGRCFRPPPPAARLLARTAEAVGSHTRRKHGKPDLSRGNPWNRWRTISSTTFASIRHPGLFQRHRLALFAARFPARPSRRFEIVHDRSQMDNLLAAALETLRQRGRLEESRREPRQHNPPGKSSDYPRPRKICLPSVFSRYLTNRYLCSQRSSVGRWI
jgi:hypothetical protein